MDTYAYRYSLKKGKSAKSTHKKKSYTKTYKPAMVSADEYEDSPTEILISKNRKKNERPDKHRLDKLKSRLQLLELMTDGNDNDTEISSLKKNIKELENQPSSMRSLKNIKGGKKKRQTLKR
jgi:hypothetical protein